MGAKKWLFFFLVFLAACQEDDDVARGSIVNVGDDVPEFLLTDVDGAQVSSASLKGKAYMLTFFDTGCRDCQQELPVLQRIYDKYGKAMPMFSVPRSQTASEVQAYWSKEHLTMPVYTASDKNLYYKFAKGGIPLTYIVDRQGKVQAVFTDSPIADYGTIEERLALCGINAEGEAAARGLVDLSFRISVPESGDKDYFQNEYSISHLEFFFFDAETGTFAAKAVAEDLIEVVDAPDNSYDITYLVESVKVQVGLYNIFVVANYPIDDALSHQDELLNMIDSVTYRHGIEASIPLSGPIMTSRATALLATDLVPWADKRYSMSVEVERVMAKLQIGVSGNSFELKHLGEKYADINITNYKIVNLNRQFYLFMHRDSIADAESWTDVPDFRLPDNFDNYNDEDGYYVVDPLFYRKTASVADATRFRDYYESWFGDFSTEGFASMPTAGNYGHAYLLENTAYRESQKNGYSPGIVFKAAVSPTLVYMYDSNTDRVIAEKRPEYWPASIYLYNYRFYGSIQAVNMAGGLELDELTAYTDSELKTCGIKQCHFNMGVYETYYTYWIRHRGSAGTSQAYMRSMEYGIVRNNFYKITITGVSGIGDSRIVPDIMRDNYPNSYADVVVE